jgi:hypothetical protein
MAAIVLILVAAFAIDRLVTGLFFLLSFSDELRPLIGEDPAHPDEHATRVRRLIYALVAGYLGIVVIAGILKVRLFEMMQTTAIGDVKPNALVDTLLTGLIMAGGADRLAELLKAYGGGGEKKGGDKPIEVTGKLVLEQAAGAAAGSKPAH